MYALAGSFENRVFSMFDRTNNAITTHQEKIEDLKEPGAPKSSGVMGFIHNSWDKMTKLS